MFCDSTTVRECDSEGHMRLWQRPEAQLEAVICPGEGYPEDITTLPIDMNPPRMVRIYGAAVTE